MPQLQAINLSKSYSNKSALIDCSFSASDGELIGILGANGAGKSTMIKILAGVLKPDTGDAILNGYSIKKKRREAKEKQKRRKNLNCLNRMGRLRKIT